MNARGRLLVEEVRARARRRADASADVRTARIAARAQPSQSPEVVQKLADLLADVEWLHAYVREWRTEPQGK